MSHIYKNKQIGKYVTLVFFQAFNFRALHLRIPPW